MKTLSTNNVNSLIGKKISWSAPASKENANYKGVAIIESVKDNNFKAQVISGDDLNFAYLDKTIQGTILCDKYYFSDDDRIITFTEIQ